MAAVIVVVVFGWSAPSALPEIHLEQPTPCPECHRALFPRLGKVAVGLSGKGPEHAEDKEMEQGKTAGGNDGD